MERLAIELHDSTLAVVRIGPDQVTFELRPAYIHKSVGKPGTAAGVGGWGSVDIIVSGATLPFGACELPVGISGGRLSVEDETWSNVIPLPFERAGGVIVLIETEGGATLTVRGNRASIVSKGEPAFTEEFTPGRSGSENL
jgi:hypothetical protein